MCRMPFEPHLVRTRARRTLVEKLAEELTKGVRDSLIHCTGNYRQCDTHQHEHGSSH